jgi:S-adenosylmethionine:tRNA ribosyltransferase-isomerase
MKLTIDQFDYHLPDNLIAQRPVEPRDESRLLTINRAKHQVKHGRRFKQLDQALPAQSILVRNNTKVIPARIIGQKPTGGKTELLLLKRQQINQSGEIWECLTKPGLDTGQIVQFEDKLQAKCIEAQGYTRLIEFNQTQQQLLTSLDQIGQTPTPPYIEWNAQDEPALRKKYQTVYAKIEGSAAAPTAGLHFTPQLNQKLKNQSIRIEEVTLHVGLGTFQPVKETNIADHEMHSEWFKLDTTTAQRLNQAKKNNRPIISVGTTTTRVLETCAGQNGLLKPKSGETDIFIKPGYKFRFIDGLITNFHLPQSTLLMLVSAFCTQPNTEDEFEQFNQTIVGQAYQQAIEKKYRFYSFGDAMLIK